jgi:anaerobic selenocysteine-containing dehydrogenase
VQRALEGARALHSRRHPERQPAIPQAGLMSLLLRLTGHGSFARLLAEPHGRRLPAHEVGRFVRDREKAGLGPIDLAPQILLEQSRRLEAGFAREVAHQQRLKLITRRHVKTHNSWTHNDPEFVSGTRHTNHLYMHPDDARLRGIADGELADVSSTTAMVRVPVKVISELQPGTVALPHGWGHQVAPGLSVASKTSGVNVNLLAADGPDAIEPVSGMARLTGILVEVVPAAGPQATESWSGIPEVRIS